jgi:glycosyltransferase involved in cell wall biosynthesis
MVLYVGAISDWFDYDLYEHGLRTAQDLSFVMIGPVSGVKYQANLARVNAFREQYSNFYYLGTKPHRELPHYLAHSAVGLIPFELLPLTHDINPIKLFEYAAFGLPVVSSAMAEIENYRDQVQIYRTPEEYIQMLGSVVQDRTRHSERMLEFARNNTWEKRFDTIFSHIEAIHE